MDDILKALFVIWIGYSAVRWRPGNGRYCPFPRRVIHVHLLVLSGYFAILIGVGVLLNRLAEWLG